MRAFTLAYVLISAIAIHAFNQEKLRRFYDTLDNCADELHTKREYNLDTIFCAMTNMNLLDRYTIYNKDRVIEFYSDLISNKPQRDLAIQIAIRCINGAAESTDTNYEKFIQVTKCGTPALYLIDPIENARQRNEITYDERKLQRFYNSITECADELNAKKYSIETLRCSMKKLGMIDKYDRLVKDPILAFSRQTISDGPKAELATSIVNRCFNKASQMTGTKQEIIIYHIGCVKPILDFLQPLQEIGNSNEDQLNEKNVENFYASFATCVEELNEKREFNTKVVRCMYNKLHFLDDQGWYRRDKFAAFVRGLVRGKVKKDLTEKMIYRCIDEAAQSSGTTEQKIMRGIRCGQTMLYLLDPVENIRNENKPLAKKDTTMAFHNALTKCSDELNVKNIYSNPVLQCSFIKVGLTDSNGWMIKDKTATFAGNLVYGTARKDMVREISNRCHDAVAPSTRIGAEKTARFIQCAKSIVILLPPIEEN